MANISAYIRLWAYKAGLVLLGISLMVSAGIAIDFTLIFFGHSPYCFVALFLIIILASNLLAKTAGAYLEMNLPYEH